MTNGPLLPVDGIVLVGGRSSRMGQDKATLRFRGRSMVELAVEKLRSFCARVTLAGNRHDLERYAPVNHDSRLEAGPLAGIEAGLRAGEHAWCLFVPVDVPLAPAPLLRAWAESVLAREQEGLRLSFLNVAGVNQPTFCIVHRDCLPLLSKAADQDRLKLGLAFRSVVEELGSPALQIAKAETFVDQQLEGVQDLKMSFSNLNTPEDLASAEQHEGVAGAPGTMYLSEEEQRV